MIVQIALLSSILLLKSTEWASVTAACNSLVFTQYHLKKSVLEFELKALEQIVSATLPPNKLNAASQSVIGKQQRFVQQEKERIKLQFIAAAFEAGGEKRIELYFVQHQRALTQIADTIYNYQITQKKGNTSRNKNTAAVGLLCKELLDCAEYLLQFIETQFPIYFDLNLKISEAYRWRLAPDLRNNLQYLETSFTKNAVPEDLINIALHPLTDYLQPNTIVNYVDAIFLQQLQFELISMADKYDGNTFSEELIHLLIRLNFNSIRFFNYYIKPIIETGKGLEDFQAQLNFYNTHLKIINQVTIIPGIVYKNTLPSLRDLIGNWISEELYCLEKHHRLNFVAPPPPHLPSDAEPKVHTSLSVAHLSMAVKLLVDSKVITNKNTSELLRMVAKNFKTDKQEQISEDSLRNKMYNVDRFNVDKMKGVIIGMLNQVRKY